MTLKIYCTIYIFIYLCYIYYNKYIYILYIHKFHLKKIVSKNFYIYFIVYYSKLDKLINIYK